MGEEGILLQIGLAAFAGGSGVLGRGSLLNGYGGGQQVLDRQADRRETVLVPAPAPLLRAQPSGGGLCSPGGLCGSGSGGSRSGLFRLRGFGGRRGNGTALRRLCRRRRALRLGQDRHGELLVGGILKQGHLQIGGNVRGRGPGLQRRLLVQTGVEGRDEGQEAVLALRNGSGLRRGLGKALRTRRRGRRGRGGFRRDVSGG